MRSIRRFLSPVLCAALSHSLPASASSQIDAGQKIHVERATAQEAREVQEVANAFMRRIRETRDVASLEDLYLEDFMRRQIEAGRAELPIGHPRFLIPGVPVSIETNLAAQVSRRDWERLYAARLNFRYFCVLLIPSKLKPGDLKKGGDEVQRKLFPVKVIALLRADPFLTGELGIKTAAPRKYTIESLEELRALVATLEQATAILRERVLKNPPEQTSIYRENLRRSSKGQTGNSARMMWPHVYGTDESRLGFPKGTRFFHIITADSLFELWLVKTDGGMKIVWARVYPFN